MKSLILRVIGPIAVAACAVTPLLAQQGATGQEDDILVARVNGEEIHRSDVMAAQQHLPEQYRRLPLQAVFPHLVEQLVDTKLAAQAAARENLQDSDAIKRRMAALRDQVLAQAYWASRVDTEVTDETLRAEYDEFVRTFPDEQEVRARHILVETEPEARAIIAELKNGADFAELARTRSKGPSGPRGGDLGYFSRDQMVKPFSDAAFGLKTGQVTENPVQTQFGWHVIMVESRRKALPPSFEEKRPELEADASQNVIRSTQQSLRENAEIERFNIEPAGR